MSGQVERPQAPWRTIYTGGVPKEGLLAFICEVGHRVCGWWILNQLDFLTTKESSETRLGRAKISDLGFTERPATADLLTRIQALGWCRCTAEAGLHLRLVLTDQPRGEQLSVLVQESLATQPGDLVVFEVTHLERGGMLLNSVTKCPGDHWSLEQEVVFWLG